MVAKLTKLAETLPSSVPFVGPEAQERARGKIFKARLGANESVFGPSPKAVEAMAKAASETWMYPDPENHDLTHALAEFHSVGPENIIVGEGIDGLLGYLVRLFVTDGNRVVTSDGAYPTFNYHVAGFGGELVKVPYVNDREDPESLLRASKEAGAKLIYFANPDNPMGTWHGASVVEDMIARIPNGALLVLDEAYGEMAPDGVLPRIEPSNPNVLRMRTFSKAYGMAGARVGYAIGAPERIEAFHKVRNHFGMTRIAQAGALAALAEGDYLSQTLASISASRDRIAKIATENGLQAIPSATNFVAVDCGKDGAFARSVLAALLDEGIFVRMPFVAPEDRCIRISCGPAAEMEAFAAALPRALHKATKK